MGPILRCLRPRLIPILLLVATPALAKKKQADAPPPDDATRFARLVAQVEASYDTAYGGYVTKNGRPSESAVQLAFAQAASGAPGPWKEHAVATVEWTLGLRDTVGGGFQETTRDQDPNQAFFSKPTDANAFRLENLITAWRATGDERYRRQATQVVDYFERILLDGRGGFVAGQNGDRELVGEANGIAIHAWLHWALVNGDPRVRDFAWRSLDRVWDECWGDGPAMLRRGVFHEVLSAPLLTDQVEMGRAFTLAARVLGRDQDRARAVAIGDLLLQVFQYQEEGGFRSNARLDDKGKIKGGGRDTEENARAVRFLAELTHLTGDTRYAEAAHKAVASFDGKLDKLDLDAADWALAVRALSVDDAATLPSWESVASAEKEYVPPRAKRYRARRR